ncbi:nuclease-related domain-containing DEAD/DEAH box helicase [Frankia nepalensis]|uniref:nuclease-related domain-containing DEAD/DEAH box helicase n=1 Tax=Frankia nepalensis TaxID=1836974 RepID=UPI0027DCBDD8|nr:UvrD-helicase domain-containing protein [Frankia nepalensis]
MAATGSRVNRPAGTGSRTSAIPATAENGDYLPRPSALAKAAQLALEIDGIEHQILQLNDLLKQLRRHHENWAAGGRGELNVTRVLVGMDDAGWHVLPDRRWPGSRHANIDVILVGPGGVFVIDVKNWREASVHGGRLWRGDADADDDLGKLVRQTVAVEEVLAEAGLPPTEVVPLLVLAGRRNIRALLDRVIVIGEDDLVREVVPRGARLAPEIVERLLSRLEQGCPPMPRAEAPAHQPVRPRMATPSRPATPAVPPPSETTRVSSRRDPAPSPVRGWTPTIEAEPAQPAQDTLMSREELWQELLDAAAREPIESWMTWLHPTQARLPGRRYSGPARIRGAAGTGKTVVALHRAKYLAARGDRVLFTSLVRTLGPVYRQLMTRMAPDQVDRVEFATVHAVATRCLREHGLERRHQQDAAETCFWRAWAQVGKNSVLPGLGLAPQYWKEEVGTVIKGRGLTTFDQYAKLARIGRRTPLPAGHRRAVWELYELYERLRTERGILDRDDVLLLAAELVRADARARYDAVIVDEVQDLTCAGLRLLHAFVGDRPDGLLVVGDGQQSIYPGGFTLAEAGVSVVGRSTVLTRNYRNRERIVRYAQAVVADDSFDDLDGAQESGRRAVDVDQPGGDVHECAVASAAAQEEALGDHLVALHAARSVRYRDMAVLVPTNAAVSRWSQVLARRGIPVVSLRDYDGSGGEAVKIGTFHRAKSLDFSHVCVPDRNRFPEPRRPAESAEAFSERVQLERRQLYVAITRARDSLWVGIREEPGADHSARDRHQSYRLAHTRARTSPNGRPPRSPIPPTRPNPPDRLAPTSSDERSPLRPS